MTLRELDRLFLRASKDIDQRQRQRILELRGLDKVLFEEIIRRITQALDLNEGRISTRKGSASINQLIDLAFRVIERQGLAEFRAQTAKDLKAILDHASGYMTGMQGKSKRLNMVTARANRTVRSIVGLDPQTGKVVSGGYIDQFFRTDAIRGDIKQAVSRAVTGGIPFSSSGQQPGLKEQLRKIIVRHGDNAGILEGQFASLVVDTYHQFDRSINKEYAKRLDLKAGIYVGGLIEDSRDFCIEKNGKVFTLKEAEKWRTDPKLPRKKSERESGVLEGYEPVVDMGRWRCRHRFRPISDELAKDMRPDLKEAP